MEDQKEQRILSASRALRDLITSKFDMVEVHLSATERHMMQIKYQDDHLGFALSRVQSDMNMVYKEMQSMQKMIDRFVDAAYKLAEADIPKPS